MAENQIMIEMGDPSALQKEQDVEINESFEIQIGSKSHGLTIAGIIIHIFGVIAAIIMAVFLIMGYPQNWFVGWNGDNVADLKILKERVIALALISSALMFTGLAMYTYGRTVRGGET
jgi:hypothetical protein